MLVIGGGGHALVSIDVLRACGHADRRLRSRETATPIGRPRTGSASTSSAPTPTSPSARRRRHATRSSPSATTAPGARLSAAVVAAGGSLARAVSPAAVVSDTATIDDGALVMPGAVVNALATIAPRRDRQHPRVHRPRVPASAPSPTSRRGSPSPATSSSARARSSASAPASRPGGRSVPGPPSAPAPRSSATSLPARRSSASRPGRRPAVTGNGVERRPARPRGVHGQPLPLAAGRGAARHETSLAPGIDADGRVRRPRRAAGPIARPPAPPRRRRARSRRRRPPQRARSRREHLRGADLILTMTSEQTAQVRALDPSDRRRSVTLRAAAWRARLVGGAGVPFADWVGRLAGGCAGCRAGRHDAAFDIADPIGGPLREYRAMGDEVRRLVQTLVDRWSGR